MEHYCSALQDEWIVKVFGDYVGYAADVGANDGRFYSNTLRAEESGWTVLCVEANPDYLEELTANRKLVEICACGATEQDAADFWVSNWPPAASALVCHNEAFRKIQVPVRTLDGLLSKHHFPRLDLLSIDVEHTELDVLRGSNLDRWRPRAIIVESFVESEERAITEFLRGLGYVYDGREGTDIMFLQAAD